MAVTLRRAFAPCIATAILAAACATPCYGQETSWLVVTTSKIKPETRTEYDGYMKQMCAAYKKSGARFFVVFQNVAGDLNEYTSLRPVSSFSEFDGPSPLQKTLGEDGYANILNGIRRCVLSQTRVFERTLPELAIDDKSPMSSTVWMRTVFSVASGRSADFVNFMKSEYKPALEKVGVGHYLVSAPTFGSSGTEYVTMRMMKNFAEIDGGPVTQKLGAEAAAALNSKSAGLARITARRLVRVRTDLSFLPDQTRAGN